MSTSKDFRMVSVESSNIKAVGYDPEREVLQIDFLSGGSYRYSNVPQAIYDEILEAQTVGRYFATRIKGLYDYERIG